MKTEDKTEAHPQRYRSRKEWIDSLKHDYLGLCPDELNGYDARDPQCSACNHIDRWDEKHSAT